MRVNATIFWLVGIGALLHGGWDQSLLRWEADCEVGMASACSIAASMYASGEKSVWDGRRNLTVSMPRDPDKARKLYEKACRLGDRDSCMQAQSVAGISQKTPPRSFSGASTPRQSTPIPNPPSGLQCDLDGDGRADRLETVKTSQSGEESFYQIRIVNPEGRLLWSGPLGTDMDNPLIPYFGTGGREVELFGDLDGDGRCEMVISLPYTEIDLVFHHRFRWNGRDFERLPDAILRQQNPPNGGRFIWEANAPRSRMLTHWYAYAIRQKRPGEFVADLAIITDRRTMAHRLGKALMRTTPGGADLIRWIEAPPPPPIPRSAPVTYNPAPPATLSVPPVHTGAPSGPPSGEGYLARIGPQDHYNSRGRRLRDLRAVLRQDRYHFYRYGGDREDGGDFYGFAYKGGRNFFDWARIVPTNCSYSHLRNAVLYGHPLLQIRKEANTLFVTLLSEY